MFAFIPRRDRCRCSRLTARESGARAGLYQPGLVIYDCNHLLDCRLEGSPGDVGGVLERQTRPASSEPTTAGYGECDRSPAMGTAWDIDRCP